MRVRRGFALASILLLGAVVLVLALTVAAVGSFQLLTAENLVHQRAALYLADGMVRWTAGQLAATPTYAPTGSIETYPTSSFDPQYFAEVTFDKKEATKAGIPVSTNNAKGNNPTGYDQSVVPNGAVQIIAVAHCGRVTRTVEAVVTVTAFPYAVAAGGSAALRTVDVRAAQSMPQYVGSVQNCLPAATLKASVAANAALKAHGYVSGDVVYGKSLCAGGLTVGGAIRPGTVCLPQLSVAALEHCIPGCFKLCPPALCCCNLTLGSCRVNFVTPSCGTYTIPGNLTMNNAELFVCGALKVGGGISGLGGVFVNGPITIGGNAQLNASSNISLDAEGNITLTGNGKNYFQGLVYSHGGTIKANSITVAGAMIAAPDGCGNCGCISLGACGPVHVVLVPCVLVQHLQTTPMASNWSAWEMYATSRCDSGTCPSIWIHGQCPCRKLVCGRGSCLGLSYSNSLPNLFIPQGSGYSCCCLIELFHPCWCGIVGRCEACYQTHVTSAYVCAMGSSPYAAKYFSANECMLEFNYVPSKCGMMWVLSLHYNALTNQYEMWQPPLVYTVDTRVAGKPVVTYAHMCAEFKAHGGMSADYYKDMLIYEQTLYMNLVNPYIAKNVKPNVAPKRSPPPYPINLDLSKFLSTSNPVRIISWRSW